MQIRKRMFQGKPATNQQLPRVPNSEPRMEVSGDGSKEKSG
jgi:hypothetical protein